MLLKRNKKNKQREFDTNLHHTGVSQNSRLFKFGIFFFSFSPKTSPYIIDKITSESLIIIQLAKFTDISRFYAFDFSNFCMQLNFSGLFIQGVALFEDRSGRGCCRSRSRRISVSNNNSAYNSQFEFLGESSLFVLAVKLGGVPYILQNISNMFL